MCHCFALRMYNQQACKMSCNRSCPFVCSKIYWESSEELLLWELSQKGASSLLCFVIVCWEEKPVPLANCYEVNECRANENMQILLLNTEEKHSSQWNVNRHKQGVYNALGSEYWDCLNLQCNDSCCLLGKFGCPSDSKKKMNHLSSFTLNVQLFY